MTDDEELIEQVARALFTADGLCSEHDWPNANEVARDHFRNQAHAILPIIKAERIRGGEMVKEAAAKAYETCIGYAPGKLAAERIRALSVPAIVENADG